MELLGRSRSLCYWVLVLVTLLVNHKVLFGCEGCSEQERSTLIEIRDSVNHPDGHGLTWGKEKYKFGEGLVEDLDCCKWPGIICNEGRVTAIHIPNTREARLGKWHPDAGIFAYLEKLSSLTLDGNQISRWDFPPACPQFKSLQTLSLENNFLNASEPDFSWLCLFTRLRVLNLGKNQLNSIPPCLEHLPSLTHLRLQENKLSPSLAIQGVCKLPKIQVLDLHSNQLVDGSIPPCLINLTQLTHLHLSNNQFGDKFPLNVLRDLNSLEHVDLSNSQLSVVFPFSIWANHVNLSFIDLSSNPQLKVETELPPWVPSFQLRHLNLSNCSLNSKIGAIPKFLANQNNLEMVDLSSAKLRGDLPSTLFIECPSLKTLKLANNRLHGSMKPLELGPGTQIASSLRVLDISENFFYGSIKAWIVSLPNLEVLTMHNNSLEGSIPNELCQMFNLRILDLSLNNLSGLIPKCFINIDPWMEKDMERKNSSLDGVVVDLTTKGRTYSFSRAPLSKMTSIDLSKNALNGVIPSEMGYLKGLHSLNLSCNYLRGSIPTTFQQLLELESLDLSYNQLNGSIPLELEKLDRLAVLSLSFNTFSGKIPQSPHLDTFDYRSYEGNPLLCGKPLEDCTLHPTQAKVNNNEEGLDVMFYVCVLVSYAIGFWGFIALLFFKKEWRQVYFKKIDSYLHF
ncbi:hypothetical protein AAC387_Pa03g0471 [Persea americana]